MADVMKFTIFIILFFINLCKSFVTRHPRLAGAKLVAPGEFPFIVLTFTVESRCTASLITSEWILSAAHCYYGPNNKSISANEILVVAGTTNFLNTSGDFTQDRVAKEVHLHPNFMPILSMNDIALVKVDTFDLNTFVSKIKLKTFPFPLSTQIPCTAVGWGDVDAFTSTSILHKLPVLAEQSSKSCPGLTDAEMRRLVCLKEDKGHGLCDGDSGSPLICSGELVGVAHEVYTIIPSSKPEPPMECGENGLVMTYMFVCPYLNWIKSFVGTTPAKPEICYKRDRTKH